MVHANEKITAHLLAPAPASARISTMSLGDQCMHHILQNGSRKHSEWYHFHKDAANDYSRMSKGKGVRR